MLHFINEWYPAFLYIAILYGCIVDVRHTMQGKKGRTFERYRAFADTEASF